jgi:hypothetical protein
MQPDDEYFRRKKDRPSHDTEIVGPMRFFRTVAGPGYEPYPATGVVYYAELQRDVSFPKVVGSDIGTVGSTGTGVFQYIGNLGGAPILEGALVKAMKLGRRWFVDAVVDPSFMNGFGGRWGLFECVYPGADLSAVCTICPCSADPWVMEGWIENLACNLDDLVPSGQPLFFDAADSGSSHCIWKSPAIAGSGGHSYVWKLTFNADLTGTIQLLDGAAVLATWETDKICCECRTCFEMTCPYSFPVLCSGLPERLCIGPPAWSDEWVNGGAGTCSTMCQDKVHLAYRITSDVPFAHGMTGYPNGLVMVWKNTVMCGWGPATLIDSLDGIDISFSMWLPPDPTGFVTLKIVYTHSGSPDCVYWYRVAAGDFDCEGSDPLTLTRYDITGGGDGHGSGCPTSPTSVTVEPAKVLIDGTGRPYTDGSGNFVYGPPLTGCDPNKCFCSCVYHSVQVDGVWTWVLAMGGDGIIIGCNSGCSSAGFPDPFLHQGETMSYHTWGTC